jgi:hypothetical protein
MNTSMRLATAARTKLIILEDEEDSKAGSAGPSKPSGPFATTGATSAQSTENSASISDLLQGYFGEEREETIRRTLERAFTEAKAGHELSPDDKAVAVEHLNTAFGRQVLSGLLSRVTRPTNFESLSCLRTLGELVSYLLSAFVHSKDYNAEVLDHVLEASRLLYTHVRLKKMDRGMGSDNICFRR